MYDRVNTLVPNDSDKYQYLDGKCVLIEKSTRQFDTGATRDQDTSKYDLEGFLSPLALEAFAKYMHKNRKMKDGSFRASDNWQKGIPQEVYMKSLWRHFFDAWKEHRGIKTEEGLETALCAIMFNSMGMLHEMLKEKIDN